jgi:hypothetical protein
MKQYTTLYLSLRSEIFSSHGGGCQDGNRSSFQNAVFSNYLEFRTIENVSKPSDSE